MTFEGDYEGEDDDFEVEGDFEIGNFSSDQLFEVFLNQISNLESEGYLPGDILAALNMAGADLASRFRIDG